MANHNVQFKDKVTLPRREYLRLKQQAQAYRVLAAEVFELPLRNPVDEVVADFRATDLYTEQFLTDVEDGLRQSSYVKKYAHRTTPKGS